LKGVSAIVAIVLLLAITVASIFFLAERYGWLENSKPTTYVKLIQCGITVYYNKYTKIQVVFLVYGYRPVSIKGIKLFTPNGVIDIPADVSTQIIFNGLPSQARPGGSYTYDVLVQGNIGSQGTYCAIMYGDNETSNLVEAGYGTYP